MLPIKNPTTPIELAREIAGLPLQEQLNLVTKFEFIYGPSALIDAIRTKIHQLMVRDAQRSRQGRARPESLPN